MRRPLSALLAAAALSAAGAEPPRFPPVGELEPALRMPEGARFEIGPDGAFLVDGRPRFLLGTIYYLAFSDPAQLAPGPGYAPEHAWIYESPPTRDYLQRLGFDSAGGEVSTTWMRTYRPEPGFVRAGRRIDWDLTTNFWQSGLPCILDLTAAVWSHGGVTYDPRRDPPERAFVGGEDRASHCISYSLVTEEGRDVWRTFWRAAAEELRAHGARPYAYELFNEPRYDDRSPGAREAFARFLSEKFGGDPAAMDAAWGSSFGSFEAAAAFERLGACAGLGVEWLKFREAAFEGGVRLGIETIRAVDPDARFCFQPLAKAVDTDRVLGAERLCQVVMTQTGGDDLWEDLRLLALADGKPLVDGETYFRNTRASHRGKLVRHFALGLDATYYFKWERRLGEVHPRDEEGLRRLFERFPWLGLNPYGTPPEALAGLMDGKRDIAAVQDLFGPRGRGIPPGERVAVLSSLPTARLAEAAGLRCHAFEREAALALAVGAHLPVDAIFEEQLPEGRLDRYAVLVAAGVAATRPATRGVLRDWVARGGTLVLAQEAMELDEYGRPSPADFPGVSLGDELGGEPQALLGVEAAPYRAATFGEGWEVIASLPDGTPAIAERRIGAGRAFYLGVRFPDSTDLGGILAALSMRYGAVGPTCVTLDPATGKAVPDIEVHAARGADGDLAFVVENRGLAPKAVRFFPNSSLDFADVSRRTILGTDKDGAFLLLLEPNVPVVLRGGTRSALEAALAAAPRAWNEGALVWGENSRAESAETGGASPPGEPNLRTFEPSNLRTLREEPYAAVLAHAPAWLAAHTSAARARAKAFSVDPARIRFLDLRDAATVPYEDRVADDGRGGWTDQGENCMENAPWEVTDCNGVPFDFIRPDENGDRAAVVLRSTRQPWLPDAVRGIRADLRAEALWFLHAGAFLEPGKEAFRYVVHYADGTSLALPMRGYVEIDDWWMHGVVPGGRDAMRCKPGWRNAKNRGFHVLRWENPFPEKTIDTIDIESANTRTAPIVEAIDAETPREPVLAVLPLAGPPRLRPWGDAHAEPKPHAESAEFVEKKPHAESAEKKPHAESAEPGHSAFSIQHSALSFSSARPWAGCALSFSNSVAVPAAAGRADLELILRTPDARPLPPLQIRIGASGGYVPLETFLRETGVPGAWRASFPVDLAAGGLRAPFREFSLQLRGERPADASPEVLVSDCRVLAFATPEDPLALRRLLPRGHHGVVAVARDGGLELAVDDATSAQGSARLDPVRPVALPADPAAAVLAFDVNGGRTPLGRRDRGRHRFRVRIECEDADGARAEGPWVRDPPVDDGPVDDDPNSWQTVRIPLASLLPEGAATLARVWIQFTGFPDTGRAGLLVRDFRFEGAPPAPSASR